MVEIVDCNLEGGKCQEVGTQQVLVDKEVELQNLEP